MSPVQAVTSAFRQYATFSGRATRPELLWFTGAYLLATFAAATVDTLVFNVALGWYGFAPFMLLVIAASVVPMIALAVRRLHDSGRPGTYYFMGLIPIAGPVLLLIALLAPSDPLPNAYGAPRGGAAAGYVPGYGYQQV